MNWLASHNRWRELAEDRWRFAAQLTLLVDGQFNAYEGMVTEQFYFIDWSALGNSVRLFEKDERRSNYDVGPHYRNHGNLAGFSCAWCTVRQFPHRKNEGLRRATPFSEPHLEPAGYRVEVVPACGRQCREWPARRIQPENATRSTSGLEADPVA